MSNIFRDRTINKKEIKNLVKFAFINYGVTRTAYLLDKLKDVGFRYSTDSGISIGPEDLKVPPAKEKLLRAGSWLVNNLEIQYQKGKISKIERFQGVLEIWLETSERLKAQAISFFKKADPLNSIYMMSFSGARGNLTQVHQLLGMRGMMANPSGELIEVPITTNFREGLTVTDYIISSYGARKGVVDTALRTADAGYLTRRLVDVAQDLIIRSNDCGTEMGMLVSDLTNSEGIVVPFEERILGRVLAEAVYDAKGNILVKKGELINNNIAKFLASLNIRAIKIRSPLTCKLNRSICSKCYGWNLAYNRIVGLGETVGVIAAQSIGEPGTQLTMRTFHTGGVFTAKTRQKVYSKLSGKICFSSNLQVTNSRNSLGKTVWITQNASYIKIRGFNNEQVRLKIKKGTFLEIGHNDFVLRGAPLYEVQQSLDNDYSQEASYRIFSDINGEFLIKNYHVTVSNQLKTQNTLAWVLNGLPISIFPKSKKIIKEGKDLTQVQCLAKLNLYNEYEGRINIHRTGIKRKNIEIEMCISPLTLDLAPLKTTYGFNREFVCVAQTKGKSRKSLILERFNTPRLNSRFGEVINNNYAMQSGGHLFYIYDDEIARPEDTSRVETLTTILALPHESHTVNLDKKDIHVTSDSFIEEGTVLYGGNICSPLGGFCEFRSKQKKVREISIRSGKNYLIGEPELPGKYKRLNKHILYPGELLWDGFEIKDPVYIETYRQQNNLFVLIRPIIYFNIPKKQSEIIDFSTFRPAVDSLLLLKTSLKFPYGHKKFIKSNEMSYVRRSFLTLETDIDNINQAKLKSNLIEIKRQVYFEVHFSEQLPLDDLIPPSIKDQEITLSTFFANDQYLEAYTNFASLNLYCQSGGAVKEIKDRLYQNKRELLIVRESDISQLNFQANEKNDVLIKEGDFLTIGTEITRNLKAHTSGKVLSLKEMNLTIREGKVYLFSNGALVYPFNNTFVKKGELIGLLKYRRARTNDIIQGLPRVESILEARLSRKITYSNKQPGIISNVENKGGSYRVTICGIIDEIIDLDQEPTIRTGQFINAGTSLTSQPFNAHTILENQFNYFLRHVNIDEAIYQSFAKVQLSLLTNVQSVYRSQGVEIADKHIEVIIRKMTCKVQIVDGGLTSLLPDDLINFTQAQLMNKSLKELSLTPVLYRPILLGISRACLKNESFLAAASFQETRRILTEAAIEGKIDWLFGIKESIIVGKMIPAGTGFNPYLMDMDSSFSIPNLDEDK